MATSGTTTFNQTRDQLIRDAFQIIGAYGLGKNISNEDMSFASNMLNKMIKAWETKGLLLFTKEEGVLYLRLGSREYPLGGGARATIASDEIATQLNGTHSALTTALTVDSTAGMQIADNIGIVLSNNDLFWTTILLVGSSTSITLSTGLPSGAGDNAAVFSYTTSIGKPLRILNARLRTGVGSAVSDLPLVNIGYQDIQNIASKFDASSPTQYAYNPKNGSTSFYVWPLPSSADQRVMITYERKIEDLTSTSHDFDFPQEWLEAITYQLATRLAGPYGKADRLKDILPLASVMLNDILAWSSEVSMVQAYPEILT